MVEVATSSSGISTSLSSRLPSALIHYIYIYMCVCVCVLCQGEREREREREYNSVCLCQWEREKNGKHLLLLFWIICLTDINSIDIKSWNKIGTIINQTSNDVELVYSLAADTADGGGHSRSESGD